MPKEDMPVSDAHTVSVPLTQHHLAHRLAIWIVRELLVTAWGAVFWVTRVSMHKHRRSREVFKTLHEAIYNIYI